MLGRPRSSIHTDIRNCVPAAALLVYDVTDKDSFDRVKSWVKELKKMAGRNIVLAIAGNKIDLDRQEELDLTEQTE